jgi:hypothetical protein
LRPLRGPEAGGRWRDRAHRRGGVPLFVEEVTRILLERGEQGWHPADPADVAAIVDGAARSARFSTRGGADWLSHRTRLFLCDHSRSDRCGGCSPASGAGPAHGSGHPVSAGHAAGFRISFQARTHSGPGTCLAARLFAAPFSPFGGIPRPTICSLTASTTAIFLICRQAATAVAAAPILTCIAKRASFESGIEVCQRIGKCHCFEAEVIEKRRQGVDFKEPAERH